MHEAKILLHPFEGRNKDSHTHTLLYDSFRTLWVCFITVVTFLDVALEARLD